MPQDLSPEQVQKLSNLGISFNSDTPPKNPTKSTLNPVIPLLSISGITLLSFSGLVLFKTKSTSNQTISPAASPPVQDNTKITPTQVPKSIQHYLLASQQYFSQALQSQQSESENQEKIANLLNQSILSATTAIKEFPQDYRGYHQRARIYQSLTDSKPEFLSHSLADLTQAVQINPSSAEITRDLAALFAKKGDVQNTLLYLNKTVALEPTKAQNFYDLAKIQQQTGLLPQALDTYNQLLLLVSDQSQVNQINAEKTALENLLAQNPNPPTAQPSPFNQPTPSLITLPDDPPTLQALDLASTGLIIASPENKKTIQIDNLVDSNSLSGQSILPQGSKEITLSNSNLTSDSQVYVTVIQGGKNLNLQVLSKSPNSFIVGLDSSAPQNIHFKWWIIN